MKTVFWVTIFVVALTSMGCAHKRYRWSEKPSLNDVFGE